jgi:hypothetical protein
MQALYLRIMMVYPQTITGGVYLILAGNLREHGKMKELVKCIRKQGITV